MKVSCNMIFLFQQKYSVPALLRLTATMISNVCLRVSSLKRVIHMPGTVKRLADVEGNNTAFTKFLVNNTGECRCDFMKTVLAVHYGGRKFQCIGGEFDVND